MLNDQVMQRPTKLRNNKTNYKSFHFRLDFDVDEIETGIAKTTQKMLNNIN